MISKIDQDLVDRIASEFEKSLESNYKPGFGIFPSAHANENYYGQVWTRDLAHAAGNYLATQKPEALKDSLKTIFAHQRADGMLPLRVEQQYLLVKLIPGLRAFAKPVFDLIEGRIRGRKERPVFEGQDFSSAEDTVPMALIAMGMLFLSSVDGEKFAKGYFSQLQKATHFFEKKADPKDGLIVAGFGNADWADSIKRGGKIGDINIWWARALSLMKIIAVESGEKGYGERYDNEYHRVEASIMEKLYQKDGAYFRAEEGSDRIDTVASIFGSLYFLDASECIRVQKTLKEKMKAPAGLRNFNPSYPKDQIVTAVRLIGHGGYHNEDIWPWVTCQNIRAKIKIATQHQDGDVRSQFKEEAVADLLDIADLFQKANGAYEIFRLNDRTPAKKHFYSPPKDFMGSMVAYLGAYFEIKKLGWF